MVSALRPRVRRLPATPGVDAVADYVDRWEVRSADSSVRSAEEWARASLEGAPRWLRWIVVVGWRVVLGLRLGPRSSAQHVLGWRMVPASTDSLMLEARSWLLSAELHFDVDGDTVRWMSVVRHRHRVSRLVWVAVGVLHRRIVPYVLARAAH